VHVYCDESGNSGAALLDAEQPFFAIASTSLDPAVAKGLIAPLLRKGQAEVKYAKSRGTASGPRAVGSTAFFERTKPADLQIPCD
jgi:hypothetical protein